MASVLVLRDPSTLRLYTKGAAEIVLGHSTASVGASGQASPLSEEQREALAEAVTEMASRGLRTLCLAYRGERSACCRPPAVPPGHWLRRVEPSQVAACQ
jgi:magnesium-transporting ATPase (P-type)